MIWSKGAIMSKKEKLKQKKKLKNPIDVQVLSSDDDLDEIVIQNVEKRRKNRQNNIVLQKYTNKPYSNQSQPYNNFNMQKIKKAATKQQIVKQDKPLQLVEDIDNKPMKHNNSRTLFCYKIQGNDATRYVSDLYLQQRSKKILQETIINTKALTQKIDDMILQDATIVKEFDLINQQEQKIVEKEDRKKAMRYFESNIQENQQNRLVKCFRCNQKGHIAKNCIQQKIRMRCIFCCGDHHHHDCNSRACFRCNEIGHVAQQCKNNDIQCRKCQKRGHLQKQCGSIKFLDYNKVKSDKQFRQRYDKDDLKKLKCLKKCVVPFGHFNCNQYDQSKVKLYQTYERQLNNHHHEDQNFNQFGQRWKFNQFEDHVGLIRAYRRDNDRNQYNRNDRNRNQYNRNDGNYGNDNFNRRDRSYQNQMSRQRNRDDNYWFPGNKGRNNSHNNKRR